MARVFQGGKLVVASHNPGKVTEIAALLGPLGAEPVSAGALGLPEPDETEDTYRGNALLKAHAAARGSGLPALADDSGLSVDALGGAPGIYSARWCGPEKDFAVGMQRVREALVAAGAEGSTCRFVCALALAWPDGHAEAFEGVVEGAIAWPPRGVRGFGYDPIFQPLGHAITFGEMEPEAKHVMSHRAAAFAQLKAACFRAP